MVLLWLAGVCFAIWLGVLLHWCLLFGTVVLYTCSFNYLRVCWLDSLLLRVWSWLHPTVIWHGFVGWLLVLFSLLACYFCFREHVPLVQESLFPLFCSLSLVIFACSRELVPFVRLCILTCWFPALFHFWSIQFLTFGKKKKIKIWSRKAEKGLIGVWHNENLLQGTNTIVMK
jgi:hypothetical protein